jgi:flagellar protein FliT
MLEHNPPALEKQALLERLSTLTDSISHAAQLADWQEAARLTQVRSPYLRMLRKEDAAAGLDVIRRIQSSDAAMLAHARTAQAELQVEYSSAMKRIKATAEYHRVAAF